ncbi:MAG: hypothetical protein LBU00_00500 [Treponema sp.]|nr:hypothetical protein [Treponema sp.]
MRETNHGKRKSLFWQKQIMKFGQIFIAQFFFFHDAGQKLRFSVMDVYSPELGYAFAEFVVIKDLLSTDLDNKTITACFRTEKNAALFGKLNNTGFFGFDLFETPCAISFCHLFRPPLIPIFRKMQYRQYAIRVIVKPVNKIIFANITLIVKKAVIHSQDKRIYTAVLPQESR